MQENTDQKKLRIRTLFTQWRSEKLYFELFQPVDTEIKCNSVIVHVQNSADVMFKGLLFSFYIDLYCVYMELYIQAALTFSA